MAGKSTVLSVLITGTADGLKKAFGESGDAAEGFGKKVGGISTATKVAMAAGGAAILGLGTKAVMAAAQDAEAAGRLAQTLKNTTGATDDQIKATEKFINKTQNATGVLDDELRPAFENLVRGTGDLAKSQDLLGLAMDISKGTGVDLASVTDSLSKAYNGNAKSLKALDPSLTALIKDGASTDEIFATLGETFGGQTARAADTMSGRLAIARARLSDVQENIGAQLLPVVTSLAGVLADKVVPAIASVTNWLGEHDTVTKVLVATVGTLVAIMTVAKVATIAQGIATTVTTVATGAWTAAQWLLNAALMANPIGLAIIALAALAAGIVVAYQKVGWFHDAIDGAWGILQATFGWLQSNWPTILIILTGPIGLAVVEIVRHWDAIRQGFADVLGFFQSIGGALRDAIVWPFEQAFDFVRSVYDHSIGPMVDAIQGIAGAGGKVAGGIKGIAGHIPGFAAGGIVNGPMLAMVGESGPEAIIPLSGSSRPLPSSSGGARGGNVVNNVTVVAPVGSSPAAIGRTLQRMLNEYERSGGRG